MLLPQGRYATPNSRRDVVFVLMHQASANRSRPNWLPICPHSSSGKIELICDVAPSGITILPDFDVEQRHQVVVLPPVQVQLVAHAQVERQFRTELEIVHGEEIVRPPVAVHLDRRKCARCRRRDAEQEVGIRVAGELVR